MNTSEYHYQRAEANLTGAIELLQHGLNGGQARDLIALAQVHAELAAIAPAGRLSPDHLTAIDTAHIDVRRELDLWVAGSGPEECVGSVHANPQWLRNHALNALAIARQIEAES